MQSITETSDWLAAQLESTGRFVRMNPGGGDSLPLVAFRYGVVHCLFLVPVTDCLCDSG
jgi:hypothetical protein